MLFLLRIANSIRRVSEDGCFLLTHKLCMHKLFIIWPCRTAHHFDQMNGAFLCQDINKLLFFRKWSLLVFKISDMNNSISLFKFGVMKSVETLSCLTIVICTVTCCRQFEFVQWPAVIFVQWPVSCCFASS